MQQPGQLTGLFIVVGGGGAQPQHGFQSARAHQQRRTVALPADDGHVRCAVCRGHGPAPAVKGDAQAFIAVRHLVPIAEGRCQRTRREGAVGGLFHEHLAVHQLEHGADGGDVGLQEAVVDVVFRDVLRIVQQVVEVLLAGAEDHRLGQVLL